jgi:hypothetical protein
MQARDGHMIQGTTDKHQRQCRRPRLFQIHHLMLLLLVYENNAKMDRIIMLTAVDLGLLYPRWIIVWYFSGLALLSQKEP